MANGNVYAPVYNSVQARGTLSPLGAPGPVKPYEKKKSLGDKMASALGDMIDQASEADKVSKKERLAQLRLRNRDIEKQHKKIKTSQYTSGVSPIVTRGDPNHEEVFLNPDYVPERNRNYPESYPDTLLEMEWFDNRREIDSLEGKVTSGFINPELNNQVLYPNYESQYFDKLPSVKNHQGAFSRLLKFTDLT